MEDKAKNERRHASGSEIAHNRQSTHDTDQLCARLSNREIVAHVCVCVCVFTIIKHKYFYNIYCCCWCRSSQFFFFPISHFLALLSWGGGKGRLMDSPTRGKDSIAMNKTTPLSTTRKKKGACMPDQIPYCRHTQLAA